MKLKNFAKIAFIVLFIAASMVSATQIPAPPQKNMIALCNCTVHPVTSEPIENASIIFDGGKIFDIIKGPAVPAQAQVIDLAGKHVYPAMIESFSEIGLTEIESVAVSTDTTEGGSINPNANTKFAVNPESEHFPVARSNGIGLAVTVPNGGIISGQASLLQMDGWTWEEMCVKPQVGMIINWPTVAADANAGGRGGRGGAGGGRGGEGLTSLNKAFEDARSYLKSKEAADKTGRLQKIDLRWEAMKDCIAGKEPVWIRADTISAIQQAVSWADRQKVKAVIVGGTEAVYCANLLKEKNVPVVILGTLRLPRSRDTEFDEPFTLPVRLQKAGVKFCIAAGGASNVRNLPYHAAKSASYGLPKDEALKSVTLYPAQIIGVEERLGSLEKGKDATLMITNGDPLEATTTVEQLYIEGRKIDMSDKHKVLYEKYQQRYQQNK